MYPFAHFYQVTDLHTSKRYVVRAEFLNKRKTLFFLQRSEETTTMNRNYDGVTLTLETWCGPGRRTTCRTSRKFSWRASVPH